LPTKPAEKVVSAKVFEKSTLEKEVKEKSHQKSQSISYEKELPKKYVEKEVKEKQKEKEVPTKPAAPKTKVDIATKAKKIDFFDDEDAFLDAPKKPAPFKELKKENKIQR